MIVLVEGNNELNISLTPIGPAVASLHGIVSDDDTGYTLSGVKVTIDGLVTYTDAYGNYGFEGLSPGSYTVEFSKDGYETVRR